LFWAPLPASTSTLLGNGGWRQFAGETAHRDGPRRRRRESGDPYDP